MAPPSHLRWGCWRLRVLYLAAYDLVARVQAARVLTEAPALLTHHQGVGGHVPEALILARDQHRYEGHQVARYPIYDA